ncbi:MAG TPA: T9SS type A sorting domain-containing protein, partial [Bacteroidia bacterium]|nr:T9SS type A sorting domain-containing protein [Bacteroidia bacterium]
IPTLTTAGSAYRIRVVSSSPTITGSDNGSNITINSLPTVTINSPTVCAGIMATLTASGTATTYTWSTNATTVSISATPTVTTNYTVTATDANGCNNIATTSINVNSLPNVTASATTLTLCAGGSTTLRGGGASIYVWTGSVTDGVGFTPPTGTNTYTVTGTDGNNCSNTATKTIVVNALPDNSTTLNGVVIKANLSGATYQWINCANNTAIAGATAQLYTATANGNYKVFVNNTTCTDTSACVSVTTVGIEQHTANANQISIYPNPNNGSFVITTSEHANTIMVTDIFGNELMSVIPNGKTTNINLSAQPSGVYFIKIIANGSQTVKRIIINN